MLVPGDTTAAMAAAMAAFYEKIPVGQVEAGLRIGHTVKLVSTRAEDVMQEAQRLLDEAAAYQSMAHAFNSYGDMRASQRILATVQASH